ncbi:hypothetical protein POVCU1_068620 [Plasmodium ovale curtisi]|uniref:Uncharacterized protein n=1 Tax=Plasmodium ovale curtisi TaxID=864141 RepID=A0A1A8X8U5_PLAOA|nr:hypothetical protein POVCU1_068620 [Plasmodium ovale curtisi]
MSIFCQTGQPKNKIQAKTQEGEKKQDINTRDLFRKAYKMREEKEVDENTSLLARSKRKQKVHLRCPFCRMHTHFTSFQMS